MLAELHYLSTGVITSLIARRTGLTKTNQLETVKCFFSFSKKVKLLPLILWQLCPGSGPLKNAQEC